MARRLLDVYRRVAELRSRSDRETEAPRLPET
jgi:hypothetical protein